MKKTIIFDFDGTLVDIEPLFFKIFNLLAHEFGYKPLLSNEVANIKKLPLKTLIWRRLGWRIFQLPKILQRGREEYHKLIPEVELFPEMNSLIATLHAHGLSIGIVSSSRKDTILALLDKFQLSVEFVYQCNLFNKAKVLKQILQERNLAIDETIYIGDEVRDVEACYKIGLDIIAVTWGLNSKEALETAGGKTVDTRDDLLTLLLR